MNQEQELALRNAVKCNDPNKVKEILAVIAGSQAMDSHAAAALAELKNYMLYLSAAFGTIDVAIMLIEAGADVNDASVSSVYRETPIFEAVKSGSAEIIDILIKAGAKVNVQDKYGWTPLMFGATRGDIKVMSLLTDAGADTSIRNIYGHTAGDILESQYPEKYSGWMKRERRREILSHEDTIGVNCPCCGPDFNI